MIFDIPDVYIIILKDLGRTACLLAASLACIWFGKFLKDHAKAAKFYRRHHKK